MRVQTWQTGIDPLRVPIITIRLDASIRHDSTLGHLARPARHYARLVKSVNGYSRIKELTRPAVLVLDDVGMRDTAP